MSWLTSLLYLLPEVWRTLREKPITVRFPFAPLDLPVYFRGKVTITAELCRGCGHCVRDCPAAALQLERTGKSFRLLHHYDRCAYCGQCELSCPFGAIQLVNAFVSPEGDRDSLKDVMVERSAPPTRATAADNQSAAKEG